MNNIDILKEVEEELKRFTKKLELAIKEQTPGASGFIFERKEYSACKRSALDLKRTLTNLTQDSKYK